MLEIFFAHDQQESPAPRRCELERAGYRVTLFENGTELLTALSEHKPDLVLLDVLLPRVHGFDICRLIRHRYSPGELPIVITSDLYRTQPFHEEAERAGAQAYLVRPLESSALVAAVERELSPRATPSGG